MKKFSYSIRDKVGIHVRPAGKLVNFLSGYKSSVTVNFGEKKANAKSVINLMSLELQHNSSIEFVIEGEDEEKLEKDLNDFLEKENF